MPGVKRTWMPEPWKSGGVANTQSRRNAGGLPFLSPSHSIPRSSQIIHPWARSPDPLTAVTAATAMTLLTRCRVRLGPEEPIGVPYGRANPPHPTVRFAPAASPGATRATILPSSKATAAVIFPHACGQQSRNQRRAASFTESLLSKWRRLKQTLRVVSLRLSVRSTSSCG